MYLDETSHTYKNIHFPMHQYQHFIFVMFSEPEKRYNSNPSLAGRGTPSFY